MTHDVVCHVNMIADYCGTICLVFNPITNTMPKTPPTMPPAPWRAAKNIRPPNMRDRNKGFMKKLPMMRPAKMVEANEIVIRVR